jgi:capsular exopolysaccharide synthesis family protein
MSRIFDALQRSQSEGQSFDFPLVSPMAVPSVAMAEPTAPKVEAEEFVPNAIPQYAIPQFKAAAISTLPDSRLVAMTDQASLGAEKFRFLGVRLRQLRQSRPLKKLLITSTIPEEGKTTVSANLAISLAQRRPQKVLLLEGDLRRPALATRFGLHRLPGLSEWMKGARGPITNIYHLEEAGFWFLPAGRPPEDPLELMQSERLAELMDQLADWFDWVLIDSPPLVPLADTSVWIRSADGILMVVREGTTRRRQLQRGLQEMDQSKLLGVVLNSSTNTDHENYYQRYGPPSAKSSAKSRSDRQDLV